MFAIYDATLEAKGHFAIGLGSVTSCKVFQKLSELLFQHDCGQLQHDCGLFDQVTFDRGPDHDCVDSEKSSNEELQ